MNAVFADTSFYQALLNSRDRWHSAARALSRELRRPVITSEYVLCELGALMSRGTLRPLFLELVRELDAARQVEIVHASHNHFLAGKNVFADRSDKSWSLTDCISFVIMQEHNIVEALTTDHHFQLAGFRSLLLT